MALDLTTAGDILKIDYQGPLREQLNNAHILLNYVKKETKNYVGKQAYLPIHKGRNVGIGARAEAGTLPTAGNQQYDSATFTPSYNYGSILLNGPTIASMKSDRGAFVRAIKSETRGMLVDMRQDLQRQVWRDGSSILTACKSTSSSTTVNCNSTKYLDDGMEIEFHVTIGGALIATGAQQKITTVEGPTSFTVPTAVSVEPTETIIRKESRVTGDWGTPLEIFGLQAVMSDDDPGIEPITGGRQLSEATDLVVDYGGIDRVTGNLFWRVNVVHNSGVNRDLTLDLMQESLDASDIESDLMPGLALTSHPIKRRYAALLQADKRYPAGGEITLDGGYRALDFSGVPLVSDKDAGLVKDPTTLNRIYFITLSNLEWQILEDFRWMDKDGAVLSRVSGKDQYEATMYWYGQLGADRINSHTVLADIKETA